MAEVLEFDDYSRIKTRCFCGNREWFIYMVSDKVEVTQIEAIRCTKCKTLIKISGAITDNGA